MVFHWSLSENKSPHVSRTLLSILADLIKIFKKMRNMRVMGISIVIGVHGTIPKTLESRLEK